jgi:hypothetical protein
VQKDLLASKLVEFNLNLLETARLNLGLCNTAKCQLCKAVGPKSYKTNRQKLQNQLCKAARPKLDIVARSKLKISLLEAELCNAARAT